MNIDPDDMKVVQRILWPGEQVECTVKQRRIGPGGSIAIPTSVVATDRRIIIVNRATLGLRHDYEVIPYPTIASVRLEHGIISSSVFIRVQGYDTDRGLLKNGKQEGEIDGLRNKDAEALANLITMKTQQATAPRQSVQGYPDNNVGGYVFCTKCGAKNLGASKFCAGCGAQLRGN
jgi:hypothetical protein